MLLPKLNGTVPDNDFFIYTACDSVYFDNFAIPLLNSIQSNSGNAVHLHIFNPRPDQLELCNNFQDLTTTWEIVPEHLFKNASRVWETEPATPLMLSQYRRTLNAMSKGKDKTIIERMQKIYFACARFIRLQSIFSNSNAVFSIDVDAIVCKPIEFVNVSHDIMIHRVTGKDPRFLAGGIYLRKSDFTISVLEKYSTELTASVAADYLYWGLDQDLLNSVIPLDAYGQLPMEYIDWNMGDTGVIWTAKGTRKDSAKFVAARNRYKF